MKKPAVLCESISAGNKGKMFMVTNTIIPKNPVSKNGDGKPRSTLADRLRSGAMRGPVFSEKDCRLSCIAAAALKREAELPFPVQVYPRSIQKYIGAWATSIFCSHDLLAVPLLAIAGAAIGRSGRRLLIKGGWRTSSCLWAVCLAESSDGKSPALRAMDGFYIDRQWEEERKWREAKKLFESDPKKNPDPGPRPVLFLTDTTTEALRYDLMSGPVLYRNDELTAWCHQMSQYKSGNADKPAWTSFWSHAPVSVGRRSDSFTVHDPFVAVTGMLVPESARELNYRGHDDDGFVHRMLISCPAPSPMIFCPVGVPEELTREYKRTMTRLFDPPGEKGKLLTVSQKAFDMAAVWCNNVHYAEVAGRGAPVWLQAKYKKLFDNLWRVSLVLHELRRVAESEDERVSDDGIIPEFDPLVMDTETVERAIKVVNYFKEHIFRVQKYLGDSPMDDIEGLYHRFCGLGEITIRNFMLRTTYKDKDRVLGVFSEWKKRGYGESEIGKRKDQIVFKFKR